jgi:hypothetical protein
MTIQDKIKAIVLDYADRVWDGHLIITPNDLNEISQRIETEVMGVEDPNAFVNLPNISVNKKLTK